MHVLCSVMLQVKTTLHQTSLDFRTISLDEEEHQHNDHMYHTHIQWLNMRTSQLEGWWWSSCSWAKVRASSWTEHNPIWLPKFNSWFQVFSNRCDVRYPYRFTKATLIDIRKLNTKHIPGLPKLNDRKTYRLKCKEYDFRKVKVYNRSFLPFDCYNVPQNISYLTQ